MKQPSMNGKEKSKKNRYKTDWSRKTPTKKSNNSKDNRIPKFVVTKELKKTKKQDYGTSKLEMDFAKQYLDHLGLVYIYQYKASDIGRYYDFAITAYDNVKYKTEVKDGIKSVKQDGQLFEVDLLIEVDGDWYHSHPRLVKEGEMNPMQKKNKRIDEQKDKWAAMHCIPLLRIWESDIRNNRKFVLDEIQKYVKASYKKRKIKENFNKPR